MEGWFSTFFWFFFFSTFECSWKYCSPVLILLIVKIITRIRILFFLILLFLCIISKSNSFYVKFFIYDKYFLIFTIKGNYRASSTNWIMITFLKICLCKNLLHKKFNKKRFAWWVFQSIYLSSTKSLKISLFVLSSRYWW